ANGTGASFVQNYVVDGLIHWDDRFLFSGPPFKNLKVTNTYTSTGSQIELGGPNTGVPNTGLVATDNYFYGGVSIIDVDDFVFRNNRVSSVPLIALRGVRGLPLGGYRFSTDTYFGGYFAYTADPSTARKQLSFSQWQGLGFDGDSAFNGSSPSGVEIYTRPNV